MAAGRPVLYIGPREATPARIIERFHCGWRIEPGDTHSLAALLDHLESSRHLIYEAGDRARTAFDQHYDRPLGVARVARILGLETAVTQPVPQPMTAHVG
jgi:hypothetical protein